MVRLLVVGLGRQGRRYLRVATGMPHVEIVAAVELSAEGPAPVPLFPSIDEALAGAHVDAAVITSPTPLHGAHAKQLLEAGIPILVEKPLATSTDEARDIVDLASGKGVFVAVGHVERFNPAVQLVRSMLAKGEVGTPISLSFRRVGLPPRSGHEMGVVHDLAVHDLDVFSYLIGEPEVIGASGWPRTRSPEAAFLLVTAGEVDGLIEANWRTPVRIRAFEMTTDTCVVSVNYTSQKVEVTEASDGDNPLDFLAFQSRYSTARRVVFEPAPGEPLAEQLRAFSSAVEGAGSDVLADALAGMRAVALVEKANTLIAR